eukprot:TRINITY_DN13201_c0_g1_i2.p1 TRINITY_DN13201_c0_g1~~TRINITY_DN13201_c0_g1_i2.p1  ORF type:complete len:365 (-),score=76.33 TRINITY_DN13201_c0_g1_i2:29-1123(-)
MCILARSLVNNVKKPQQYWHDTNNQRHFFDQLVKELGIYHAHDCKSISLSQTTLHGARTLTDRYAGSITKLLHSLYPEIQWRAYHARFHLSKNFWGESENLVLWMDFVGNEVDLRVFGEWYAADCGAVGVKKWIQHRYVSDRARDASEEGGKLDLLRTAYTQFPWQPTSLRRLPSGLWRSAAFNKHIRSLLQRTLKVEAKEDWYRLSQEQMREITGRKLKTDQLYKILEMNYPREDWKKDRFSDFNKKARQRMVLVQVRGLFPGAAVVENDRSLLCNPETGCPLEVDLYVPSEGIAFEFQGEQHYVQVRGFADVGRRKALDALKRELCRQKGVLLVVIPYHWDNTTNHFKAIISQQTPRLQHVL